jgi:alanyl-tRNA synthetase
MPAEKEIKRDFRTKAQREPEKHYPVEVLKEEGFLRKKCISCGNYFWAADPDRNVCGEPECSGGYTFIGDSPAKEKMDYIQTWKRFAELFEGFGYTPIPRYPTVARWRDDTDFVQASIYDFQPYCVSGEVDPPANPLVVPQFCLRFNDTDNVGITGRHYTGFVMIGQHAFQKPENYKPKDYLRHIYAWLVDGMKIPKEEIQFHEDAWAGGGNMGPSMEFFSRGLEIGNQVYMLYDIKAGVPRELEIKVLDMGMGQERPAWFTLGTSTSYEAVFPTVVDFLFEKTGMKPDQELMQKFIPYSGVLTIDEVDIRKIWEGIAESIGESVDRLKEQVLPLAAIYSIGDHTRSLLLALSDGALPSNVGGGYNLRVLVRRSLDLIARYEWEISLSEVCEIHAHYLKPQYPELMEHLDEVSEILEVEKKKYRDTKEKSRRIVERLKKKEVSLERLIELYDSQGISPEMLKGEGLDIEIPPDFFIRVAERHEREAALERPHVFREFNLDGIEKTEVLYYDDYRFIEFKARVIKILEDKYVVLDKTAFYPTSGGQLTDKGYMNGSRVTDVFKQGNVIIHRVEEPTFKEGEIVECKVDWERRRQLAQHHTATHIINGVARALLGEHVWQAGAEKTPEKSRLDITHFASLTKEHLRKIEEEANRMVARDLRVEKSIYKRDIAEASFGFRLYQGGAVPGKEIRVVKIEGLDTEACGGTHLNSTGEAEYIKLIGSTKIQDGVIRLEYVAGEAARRYIIKKIFKPYRGILQDLRSDKKISDLMLDLNNRGTLAKMEEGERVLNLLKEKSIDSLNKKELSFMNSLVDEVEEAADVFSVTLDQLKPTVNRFLKEVLEDHGKINRLRRTLKMPEKRLEEEELFRQTRVGRPIFLPELCQLIFMTWKEQKKDLERLVGELARERVEGLAFEKIEGYEFLCEEMKGSLEEVQKTAQELLGVKRIIVLFGLDEKIFVVGMRGRDVDIDMGELVKRTCEILGGGGGGKPDFARGAGKNKEKLKEAKEWVAGYIREKLT